MLYVHMTKNCDICIGLGSPLGKEYSMCLAKEQRG